MAIRVIYAPLTGAESDSLVFAAAGAAAQQFTAHVDVAFQCADPRAAIPYLGEGISGDVVAQFVESAEKENAVLAQRAHTEFNVWRGRVGLTLAEEPAETGAATCSWRESDGMTLHDAGDARLADLVIAARGGDAGALDSGPGFEISLMHSGRPVLLVGSTPGLKLGNHILIAWNGSAEASRAIAAAIPFLRTAQSVAAITAPESDVVDSTLSDNLTRYLA